MLPEDVGKVVLAACTFPYVEKVLYLKENFCRLGVGGVVVLLLSLFPGMTAGTEDGEYVSAFGHIL